MAPSSPGRWQLPLLVLVHTALLIGCAVEPVVAGRSLHPWLAGPMLTLLVAAQLVRLATMRALGRRWTARVLVLPGTARVTSGPYRLLRHPNYAAVLVEGIALPLTVPRG